MQEKAKGVGFEFENSEDSWLKVEEEILEFKSESDPEKREKEMGDIFFALINYARISGINPENALEKTNQKFLQRFEQMEKLAGERGLVFSELNLEQQDKLWDESKIILRD